MSEPIRKASVERKTRETEVQVQLVLDGSGAYEVSTGIPFFDHMLESFAKHGLFDLRLRALREAYGALGAADRARVEAALAGTGCELLFGS